MTTEPSPVARALAALNAAQRENDAAQAAEAQARKRAGNAAFKLQDCQRVYDHLLKTTRRIAADPVDGPKAA